MKYVQIGVTALRTPTGDFMPSVPLYIKEEDVPKVSSKGDPLLDISKIFAEKFKEYADKNKKIKD